MTPRSTRPARRPARWLLLALTLVASLLAAACGTTTEEPFASNPTTDGGGGGGATTTAPSPDAACDAAAPERSLAPEGPLPPAGQMPAGSTMEAIAKRPDQKLRAGVGADTLLFGFLNPKSGDIEGFDVEMARLVARAIFGTDVGHLDLIPLQSSQRIPKLEAGDVDLVVKTMTINCDRWGKVNFSSVYYNSAQRLLVRAGSPIKGLADAISSGATICAVSGTTSLDLLIDEGAEVSEVGDWTDCLVEFQAGRVDGISTDDTILAGLSAQDPYAEIEGDPLSSEPYGIALPKGADDFTRFVNAVLEQARAPGGEWQVQYDQWLAPTLGPSTPPAASYRS
ncbi:MAG: glutamate ABC transporter substrate-binding protein [Acidimicrobiales bacterium]